MHKKGTRNNKSKDNASNVNQSQSKSDNTTSIDNDELIRQLEIIDISINTIYIIIISILNNIDFLFWERAKLLDQINGTNYAENQPDKSDNPKISNRLSIYAAGVSLCINWQEYQKLLSVSESERDEKEIKKAYHSLISSLLVFAATIISRYNLLL